MVKVAIKKDVFATKNKINKYFIYLLNNLPLLPVLFSSPARRG
jgi:hypothetical protein